MVLGRVFACVKVKTRKQTVKAICYVIKKPSVCIF